MGSARGGLTNGTAHVRWPQPTAPLSKVAMIVWAFGIVGFFVLFLGVVTLLLALLSSLIHLALRTARNALGFAPEWQVEWNQRQLLVLSPDEVQTTLDWSDVRSVAMRDETLLVHHSAGRLEVPAPPELDDAQWVFGCWEDIVAGRPTPPMMLSSDGYHEELALEGFADTERSETQAPASVVVVPLALVIIALNATTLGVGLAAVLACAVLVGTALWLRRGAAPTPIVVRLFATHMVWLVPSRRLQERFAWDEIEDLEGDGQMLVITTSDARELRLDLSASPLAHTWDLGDELRIRQLAHTSESQEVPKALQELRTQARDPSS